MNIIKTIIICGSLLLIPFVSGPSLAAQTSKEASCTHDSSNFRCVEVLKNYDGDTLTVNIPGVHPLFGQKVSVRIAGIDTPEVKTKDQCEKQAARVARQLVETTLKKAKSVDLLNVQRDKYFRILADVSADGILVKDILLKNNLAYAYDGGTKKHLNWCSFGRQPAQQK